MEKRMIIYKKWWFWFLIVLIIIMIFFIISFLPLWEKCTEFGGCTKFNYWDNLRIQID